MTTFENITNQTTPEGVNAILDGIYSTLDNTDRDTAAYSRHLANLQEAVDAVYTLTSRHGATHYPWVMFHSEGRAQYATCAAL